MFLVLWFNADSAAAENKSIIGAPNPLISAEVADNDEPKS